MADLVLVHGTWGRAQPWHLPGSALRAEADAHGFTIHDFLWSGVLAGVPTKLPGDPTEAANGADNGMLLPWLDAGEKLLLFCRGRGLMQPCFLTHSHGLHAFTFYCVKGGLADVSISISGPIRRDALRARRIARDGVRLWVQFADPLADRTILEGEWFDGDLEADFSLPEGVTVTTPGSGHSGIVNDPALRAKYGLWGMFAQSV